jgi:hypothetical protein
MIKITPIFVIGSILCLLTAGCLTPGISPLNTTNRSLDHITSISQSITVPNETYWIHINSVRDHIRGENFTLNGTTNLPIGDRIGVQIYSTRFKSIPSCPNKGEMNGVIAIVNVSDSVNPWNIWSLDVNSHNLCPEEYQVEVYPLRNSASFNNTNIKFKVNE